MIGGCVRGWSHGAPICLCWWESGVHPCGLLPHPPIDGVVPTSVGVLHVFLMMLHLSTNQIYEDWILWIWWSRDGPAKATYVLERAKGWRISNLVFLGPYPPYAMVVCPVTFSPWYILKNVPPLGDSQNKVLEGKYYVCQYLGDPICVHAAGLGSYSHQPWWLGTNLTPPYTLAATFSTVPPSFDKKVDDILDPRWTSLPVVRDDLLPVTLVNKVRAPRWAFPAFMIFP